MKISDRIVLERPSLSHSQTLFELISANDHHLRAWMPWLDINRSEANTHAFLRFVTEQYETGRGPQYLIFFDSVMCGMCGFHPLDNVNRIGGIGYWLSESHSGRGIMTQCVRALLDQGFEEYNLNRIEIACATENYKSRAVAERLGFTLEGILRQNEYLYGRYVDHAMYSMLAAEYEAQKQQIRAACEQQGDLD